MRKVRRVAWIVLLPLTCGAAVYGATRLAHRLGPVIDAPYSIELGTRDQNAIVKTEVHITNAGRQPLELNDFATSCPLCIHIGRSTKSGFEPAQQYTIQPGEVVSLSARLGIHSDPGKHWEAVIVFHTNDPRQTEHTIHFSAHVRGRILAFPSEVECGQLAKGSQVIRTIEIRDTGRGSPCRISRVESSDPKLFQARGLRSTTGLIDSKHPESGERVGEFEVVVATPSKPGQVDGKMTVFEEGRDQPLLSIPIHGYAPAEFEVTPAAIVLPRTIGRELEYSMTFVCRSVRGKPIRVDIKEVPEGITVAPIKSPESAASSKSFSIRWNTKSGSSHPSGLQKKIVRVRLTAGDLAEVIELPIMCLRP